MAIGEVNVQDFPVILKTENKDKGGLNYCVEFTDLTGDNSLATYDLPVKMKYPMFISCCGLDSSSPYTGTVQSTLVRDANGVIPIAFSATPGSSKKIRIKVEGHL